MGNKNISRIYPLYLAMPVITIFSILFVLPFFMAVFYSFTDWNLRSASFIGLDNYIEMLTNPELNIAFKNTFIFAGISTLLKVCFGLILALLLNRHLKTRSFLRSVFFLPAVINNVAVGIAFIALLHPTTGLVNRIINATGLTFLAQDWLADPRLAIYSASMVEVWKYAGLCMIIFLAALQTISHEYYEASDIDGANSWQKFRNITFPLILPAFNNVLVISIIGGLKVFDIILATTGGGPGRSSFVLNVLVYNSFSQSFYGEACAGSTMLALIVGLIAFVVYKTVGRKEVEL